MPCIPVTGISGLQRPRAIQRAGVQCHQPEAAPLVEAQRAHVVVGGDQQHLAAAGGARRLDGAFEQGGARGPALLDGVQRDDFAPVALDQVSHEPRDVVPFA